MASSCNHCLLGARKDFVGQVDKLLQVCWASRYLDGLVQIILYFQGKLIFVGLAHLIVLHLQCKLIFWRASPFHYIIFAGHLVSILYAYSTKGSTRHA